MKSICTGLSASYFLLSASILLFTACSQPAGPVAKTDSVDLRIDTVATGISIPFGMAFLPSGQILVTDRGVGKIWRVDPKDGSKTSLKNVPVVHDKDQAGVLDIALHPDYAENGWVYFSFSMIEGGLNGTAVERARIDGDSLVDRQRIFTTHPFYKNGAHYGSRFVFDKGYLYFTIGERYELRDSSQTLGNHLGKVLRIMDDGGIPSDNPFVGRPGARPEIWSYGHRNPQGLALHPQTGELWESEHGPKGGDELNLVKPGLNYGWPVITYGVEYSGATIGDGIMEKEGMEQPVKYYKPSIGPSGLVIYDGDKFPSWKGDFFTGALALTHLNRLVVADGKVVREERLLADRKWRVRNVCQGPDGYLYLGVDGGMVLRLRPAV